LVGGVAVEGVGAEVKEGRSAIIDAQGQFGESSRTAGEDDENIGGEDVDMVSASEVSALRTAEGKVGSDGDFDPWVGDVALMEEGFVVVLALGLGITFEDADGEAFAGLGLAEGAADGFHHAFSPAGQEMATELGDQASDRFCEVGVGIGAGSHYADDFAASDCHGGMVGWFWH